MSQSAEKEVVAAMPAMTRCLRCNRLLKRPESVKNGQGPTCYLKSEAEQRLARIKQRDIEEVL